MSSVAVLAPRRLVRLFAADVTSVTRDPMLVFAIVLSLLPALALYGFRPVLEASAFQPFGGVSLLAALAAVALVLPSTLIGWVTGFLLLEDRDSGTLLAIDVTPVGKLGFIAYRVLVTALVTGAITSIGVWLLGVESHRVALVVLVGAEAVIAAMLLPAIARNKVEGLALTKLTNIFAVIPLIAMMESPWRFLAGLFPSYWLGELLFGSEPQLPEAVTLLLAATIHAAWMAAALWLFSRKLG